MTVACLPAVTAQDGQIGFKRELGKDYFGGMASIICTNCLNRKRMKTREAIIRKREKQSRFVSFGRKREKQLLWHKRELGSYPNLARDKSFVTYIPNQNLFI